MATKRLTVELEPDPIPRGSVAAAGGQRFAFVGWIGLAAALKRARAVASDPDLEGKADGTPGRTAACG